MNEEFFIFPEIKKTKWQKFCDFFWSLDITYVLPLICGAMINTLVLKHLDWSFWEKITEALCFGFLLPLVLKR